MVCSNIFYKFPSRAGTRVASFSGSECTVNQLYEFIANNEGLDANDIILANGTKTLRRDSGTSTLSNNSLVNILIPLPGGKGGFGSLLRAIGAQIEKTTNRDACRDLSGRRLRDIKREEELKKLLALQEKLEKEKEERKKDQYKKKNGGNATKTSGDQEKIDELVALFNDQDYDKRHLELGTIIDAAIDKGLINFKKRQQEDIEDEKDLAKKIKISKPCDVVGDEIESNKISEVTKTLNQGTVNKINRKDLWLGLDDEDDED